MGLQPSRTERLHQSWLAMVAERQPDQSRSEVVKTWTILKTTYKVSDFIGWQRNGLLKLNPEFQRRSVWKQNAKSYLIDTIIKGLPIPIVFLRDKTADLKTFETQRDVVDGQQRLRTVIAFVAPSLLADLDPNRDYFKLSKSHNKELAGKSFGDLSPEVKSLILDYQFTVNVFPSDMDDREVYQVFARMNSSGYKLNAQELRNAEFFGEFKAVAQNLATEQLQRWRNWHIFNSDAIARMKEVELSSELIMLMLNGIMHKNEKTISDVYEKYEDEFQEKTEVEKRFRAAFDAIDNYISSDAVLATFSNVTLFYALFATVYDKMYSFGANWNLSRRNSPRRLVKSEIMRILTAGGEIANRTAPQDIVDASTKATTDLTQRTKLINFLSGHDTPNS